MICVQIDKARKRVVSVITIRFLRFKEKTVREMN